MIEKLLRSLFCGMLFPLTFLIEFIDSWKKAKHLSEKRRAWREKGLSFEDRAKEYFEAITQFYESRGGSGNPILEIRDFGVGACPNCSVEGAMLIIREFGFILREDWHLLRDGTEPAPSLYCFCCACRTRPNETKDYSSYIHFLGLPLANLPYLQFEFQLPEWVYLLECYRDKEFIHPKDCPTGYTTGILVQAYPENHNWKAPFDEWSCIVLLVGSTHYSVPFSLDPYKDSYHIPGVRVMRLDDMDLISYDIDLVGKTE